jgi:hypothetical protein
MPLALMRTPANSSAPDMAMEANHRIGNNLSLIAGLARQSASSIRKESRTMNGDEVGIILEDLVDAWTQSCGYTGFWRAGNKKHRCTLQTICETLPRPSYPRSLLRGRSNFSSSPILDALSLRRRRYRLVSSWANW